MEYVQRDFCVLTQTKDLEHLATFPKFPVFMGCTRQDIEEDLVEDMNWYISRSTGSIQLNPLLPLPVLYPDQHNEVVGGIWHKHHEEFARFISEFDCRSVFEIGAAHGILAKNYHGLKPTREWTILEPNPRIVDGANAKVIRGFFDSAFRFEGTFDAVVHSHVFEHIYFPREFIETLGRFIPNGRLLIFSIPNMMAQLKANYTNCLNFEHTCFLIEPYLDWLLENNGFSIINKNYFQDHSIFYAARKENFEKKLQAPDFYAQNKGLFLNFVDYHRRIIKDLNDNLNSFQGPCYLFGAHIFSQFLLNFGLSTRKIIKILDNGPNKIGKRLYGTHLMVDSPKTLKDKGQVAVVLKAGTYNEEIRQDILRNINSQVVFFE